VIPIEVATKRTLCYNFYIGQERGSLTRNEEWEMLAKAGGKRYQNFVITIHRVEGGDYRVEARGPTGEAAATFALPFDAKDLKIFLLEIGYPRRMTIRGRVPEPLQSTVDFGRKLFDAAIGGQVRDLFVSARHDAERGGYGLRLQLRLSQVPELAGLPWEFLYDGRDFLALCEATPLVRYLDLPNPPRPMEVSPPLRILVTVSAPLGLPALDVAAEEARVREALAFLAGRGMLEIDVAPDATLYGLRRAMRRARSGGHPYHVWHYVGHGAFDPAQGASVLAFCDRAGVSSPVGGFQLGTLFNGYPEMRLVLLNACEGARPDLEDPFAGVAAALVERGVPAVIGMQREISDEAAATLAGEFYEALVDGLPVDAALTEARLAVFSLPNWVEWATPVLFMRAPDGRIFDLSTESPAAEPAVELPAETVAAEQTWEPVAPQLHVKPSQAGVVVRPSAAAPLMRVEPPDPERAVEGALPVVLAIAGPIHLELVRVPAGEFLMGSDPQMDQDAEVDERPQHRVEVAESYIGRYPVTVAQFRAFVEGSDFRPDDSRCLRGPDDHPVAWVSWDEAVAFCEWLNRESGRPFRLPSEAEWEKAARGADGRVYPWGDPWDGARCNTRESGIRGTSPVGHFSPVGDSPYGVADMAGNVWEWCQSLYWPYPYRADEGREDLGVSGNRVLRGGSWRNSRAYARCACRNHFLPNFRYYFVGFRVLLAPAVAF
jgi:formylglycine-generating enzyme required for sulfatase activity